MIEIGSEHLRSFKQAAGHPAMRNSVTGKPCHVSKIIRLAQFGALATNGERIKLECMKLPSGWHTSDEAIDRLVQRLTNPTASTPLTSPQRRQQQRDFAERELRAAGFELGKRDLP